MKYIILFILSISVLLSSPAFAQNTGQKDPSSPPRQKIYLAGALLNNKIKSNYSIPELETFLPLATITIKDPYNFNKSTSFTGYYLADFLNKIAKVAYAKIKVSSYDGYVIEIDKKIINQLKLFIAIKNQEGYIGIERMGPARIIAPIVGALTDEDQVKDGVYWVWQLKTIEII